MAKLRNKFQEPVIDFFFLNMCLFHVFQLDFSPVGMLARRRFEGDSSDNAVCR